MLVGGHLWNPLGLEFCACSHSYTRFYDLRGDTTSINLDGSFLFLFCFVFEVVLYISGLPQSMQSRMTLNF